MARGDATEDSDVDLLVVPGPDRTPFFPGGLVADLEELLGRAVQVVSERALHPALRNRVLVEAQRLSEGLKAAHADVPWRAMAGSRNVLVHDYLGIDLEEVWKTIEEDLPPLRARVEAMLVAETER